MDLTDDCFDSTAEWLYADCGSQEPEDGVFFLTMLALFVVVLALAQGG